MSHGHTDEYLDKTAYLSYLQCPKNAWLKMHRPDLGALFGPSQFERSLSTMGHEVELVAQSLFHHSDDAPVLFQPTFIFDGFTARADVLAFDGKSGLWDLYEIKASVSVKEESGLDHIEDVSFQAVVIQGAGLDLGRVFIMHLNKDYVRGEELGADQLFVSEDMTEHVQERESETRENMHKARSDLLQSSEDAVMCGCVYKGRSSHCATFKYSHPDVPAYSVHDIARIGSGGSGLKSLVDAGIYCLNDVPEFFHLTDIQNNQVGVYKTRMPIIRREDIRKALKGLEYPLHFLDYETYAPAIPIFNGFHPFDHIPFQFSVHIATDPESEPESFEYLHDDASDPTPIFIEELRSLIGPKGSIIVWNKSFEQGINTHMADRDLRSGDFLRNMNDRIYDLMDIFKDQMYVHHEFEGRTSIKKILPVLVPGLGYEDLEIQEGASASQKWHDMVFGGLVPEEKEAVLRDLMDYCGHDTYAMYAIWKFLMREVSTPTKPSITETISVTTTDTATATSTTP